MARNWVRLDHAVTMIAEVPNHPSGIIAPEYRGKPFERSRLEGIDVIRVWVKTSPVKNFRNRIMFYLTYMINATLAGLLLARGHYDLIYASSPPLFVGGAALALKKLRGIPLVFEVRDLWPESAVALGELNNRSAIAWATALEEACYRNAKRIIVVTQGIRDRLEERGIQPAKIILIPNGANIELFQFNPQARIELRRKLDLGNKFTAIYAGIHGVAQGLEFVLEAARLLEKEAEIHFLLVGDGPKKTDIVALARKMALSNLTMLPEQPREAIPGLLSAADAAIIPLRKIDLFKGALPSKIFDAWACERPVLLSVDGEARQIVETAGGGWFVPPEDPQALAQAILALKANPGECKRLGANGRVFTERKYSRRALAEELLQSLV